MNKTIFTVLTLAFLGLSTTYAQVGIGTITPHASAMLDVESTDKGFLPPRMTTTERDAINGGVFEEGLTIFNTTVNCLQWWNGKGWYDGCDKGLTAGPESACPLIPPYLSASETVVKNVSNPVTGKTWMDRNLGAYGPARSSTDCWAYGNLYQWGRAGEGHEYRSSDTHDGTTVRPLTITTSGAWDGKFITLPINPTNRNDWVTTQTDNAWNSGTPAAPIKTATDPCPTGYRVPSEAELNAERTSWGSQNIAGAIGSPLKLPAAGFRDKDNGVLGNVSTNGIYWSSAVFNSSSKALNFNNSSNPEMINRARSFGFSVRCIKD